MATDGRRTLTIHRCLLVSLLLLPGFLAGCSLFRNESKPSVEVETPAAPERKSRSTVSKNGDAGKKNASATTRPAASTANPDEKGATPPDPAAAPVDSSLAPPELPVHRPTVSAVLTPTERSTLEAQYRTDVERTALALDTLAGRSLTPTQAEQKASTERFLSESRAAFEGGDLPRAASLVEKARIIAEELKSGTGPN